MTVAPSHPLEHAYLGDHDPEEMIDTRIGRMERWRADALLVGETSALAALRDHVRNDAVSKLDEVEERERVVTSRERAADARDRVSDAREHSLLAAAKTLNDAVARFEQLQCRADQEPEPLAHPPGALQDAALPGDPSESNNTRVEEPGGDDDTHVPTGDLHAVAPVDPEQHGHPAAEPATEPDAHGEFLRLHNDQTEFPDPELAKPPVVQQPTAIGFD